MEIYPIEFFCEECGFSMMLYCPSNESIIIYCPLCQKGTTFYAKESHQDGVEEGENNEQIFEIAWDGGKISSVLIERLLFEYFRDYPQTKQTKITVKEITKK